VLLRIREITGELDGWRGLHGAESPDAFARQLKDAARRYYGAPLRAFLDCVAWNRGSAFNVTGVAGACPSLQ
jgi:hypothetical protein